jgi:RNA polymerase sigma-70 factor, ECF subfamily
MMTAKNHGVAFAAAPVNDTAALFRAHAAFVARFLCRLGIRRDEIEDMVQEVFLIVHRRGGFEEREAKATTYLAQIAFLLARDRRRLLERRKTDVSDDLTEIVDPTISPEDRAALTEKIRLAERALQRLPPELCALFVLFELENESCGALAAAFDLPIGTVHSRLRLARREFINAYNRLKKEKLP